MNDVRSESEPTQESWNVHLVISEAGSQSNESRTRFEIRADYMATFETSDSTYTVMQSDTSGRRVLAHFYNEAGDTSATLHADRLVLHDEDRRFEAMDNVIVVTPDEKTLESEHLVWLEDDRKLRTPGFVRITTPNERVQGYNLLADEDLSTYTLARVTGQVTVEDDTEEYDPEDTEEYDPEGAVEDGPEGAMEYELEGAEEHERDDTSSVAPVGEVIGGQEADSGDRE
jgi:LPS export ABC transporter protein LptC